MMLKKRFGKDWIVMVCVLNMRTTVFFFNYVFNIIFSFLLLLLLLLKAEDIWILIIP